MDFTIQTERYEVRAGGCELWIKIDDRSATMACSISSCAHGASDAPFSLWAYASGFSCGSAGNPLCFPQVVGTFLRHRNSTMTSVQRKTAVKRFHELACRSGTFCWPPSISLDGLGWSVPTPLVSCAQSNTSTEVHFYLIGLVYHGMV